LAALAWRLATFFCEANWLAVGALSIPSSSSSSGAVRVFSQGVQNSDGEQIQPPGFWRATGGDHGPSTAISDMGFCTARIGFCFILPPMARRGPPRRGYPRCSSCVSILSESRGYNNSRKHKKSYVLVYMRPQVAHTLCA
jgi:hypothetical protein